MKLGRKSEAIGRIDQDARPIGRNGTLANTLGSESIDRLLRADLFLVHSCVSTG
jgi:hypothetical protein